MKYIFIALVALCLAGCSTHTKKPQIQISTGIKVQKEKRRDVQYITIHHTDGVMEEANKAIKKFNGRHRTVLKNKVSCMGYYVAYHYVIGINGDVVKTRCEYEVGNHDPNHNSHSIGIALVGTFYSYEPTEAQYKSLNKLIEDIKTRYDGISILAHRGEDEKDPCPGPMFNRYKVEGIKILSIK